MKQKWFKTKTMLCAFLCLLCVMTGCAGEYPAQSDMAEQNEWIAAEVQEEAEAQEEADSERETVQDDVTAEETSEVVQSEEIQTDGGLDNEDSGSRDNKYIDREGSYTTAEDVALYLYTYDELPDNFMTKDEARELGWSGGSLEKYAPGMCIGGDYFGNYEGILPEEPGRDYYECDIDTLGAQSRGPKRIVYSDDGLIYYTEDHYETFTLLYGEE